MIATGIAACGSTDLPQMDAGSGADAASEPTDTSSDRGDAVTDAGDCPGLLAGLTARVVPIDAGDCLARPAMDCTSPLGLSEQNVVSQWWATTIAECGGFPEETVAVSFENGCATELRFSSDRPQESVTCVTGKVSAVRWACHDLACASVTFSTLP